MESNSLSFTPIISSIQKIVLYETKQNFYLIGTNNTQTRYRVLKIDRTEPKELIIHDDKVEYTRDEIHDLVCMIEGSNRQRSGVSNVISAFGIIGFIRFLEGYYIILITKRQKVAIIGHHTIYKIEHTTMIYLPHDSVRLLHPDETRYLKMFQNIDLSSNFYYSYSYDLTHTLQHNLSSPKQIIPQALDESEEDMYKPSIKQLKSSLFNNKQQTNGGNDRSSFGIRSKPHRKFVWNSHLLKYVERELHQDWILYITHGFVGQSNMCVFGRSIYVTLIARRSAKYAGTRFLKRGANFNGDVANEVETEQVVHDAGVSSLSQCHITSFVQIRGSIPGHWRQEMGKIVAKPAITIDLYDPFAETAGAHFNELLKRYGAPIVVLNLVKQREKKKQESLLSEELNGSIKYLNQFLPQEYQIIYKTFDMARKNKNVNANVMDKLAALARYAVMKTGIFHNQPKYYSQKPNTVVGQPKSFTFKGSLQTGIVRTNCVDCLDRTNTAQFAIGKCVLGYQLCALGVLDNAKLEFDTDCVRMLESLYEDHGDTLALQYGGSQLVHRVKTYRKTSPWTSQGNDIMQTLSRYYSNTFSDAEKQNTINLFLGVFIPDETKPQIWDYSSDHYFHHKINLNIDKSLTQWYGNDVLESLPYAYNDLVKPCSEIVQIHAEYAEMIDAYADFHRPYELTVLNETFSYKISNTIRDFMPNNTTNSSPFTVRIRPGRRREESSNKNSMKNPSLTGQSSTSSTTSSNSTSSSGSDTNSSDEESVSVNTNESQMTISRNSENNNQITFQSLFPSMEQTYGYELKEPSSRDVLLYKKYVLIGGKANGSIKGKFATTIEFDTPKLSEDSIFSVDIFKTPKESLSIYEDYVKSGIKGAAAPSKKDMDIYNSYLSYK